MARWDRIEPILLAVLFRKSYRHHPETRFLFIKNGRMHLILFSLPPPPVREAHMKRRALMMAATAIAILPGIALAHGPTRQKVTLTTEVSAEPAKVRAAIGDFQDMSWHPVVFSTDGTNGNEIDETRILARGEEGGQTISEVLRMTSASFRTARLWRRCLWGSGPIGSALPWAAPM